MGKKVNPFGFRLMIEETPFRWQSKWFTTKKDEYRKLMMEDLKIREFLEKKLELAGLVEIEIRRLIKKMKIVLKTSRPGMVIGRGGKGLEVLKKGLCRLISLKDPDKNLEIEVGEVKNPELFAKVVAERIALQLERRMPTRRVTIREMERVMAAGALGVKIVVSGRIDGAKISRQDKHALGKMPLSTLRANIDYAEVPALTRSGYVGVKVFINRKKEHLIES